MNELFEGWSEHPPTNLLVKAIVEGLGGGRSSAPSENFVVPPEAQKAMQDSALAEISVKAGHQLPVLRGRDPGLPPAKPVFDLDEMKARNAEILQRRSARGDAKRV